MTDNPRNEEKAPRIPTSQVGSTVPVSDNPEAIGALVAVTIDGIETKVPFGMTILDAAKTVGVDIPTLCNHPDLKVAGVCRMCVVDIEGQRTLQAACVYPITNPLTVSTHTRKVRKARRHVLELLLSEHYGECYSCVRNGNCELQSLAEEYGISSFTFGHPNESQFEPDFSSYSVMRDMDKCIRCRRCVRTCIDLQEVGVLEAVNRSDDTVIATFEDLPLGDVVCINCGQCVNRCPTGALYARDETDAVWAAIDDPTKHVVIQTAPAPRSAMGELFGLEPGTPVTFEMNTALRRAGFDSVFDTNFTRRPHDHRGGHGAHPAALRSARAGRQGRRAAAVHELLAGLGQVPRALLPRVPAQRLVGQEPAADVRRAHQDLLRREARRSIRPTS